MRSTPPQDRRLVFQSMDIISISSLPISSPTRAKPPAKRRAEVRGSMLLKKQPKAINHKGEEGARNKVARESAPKSRAWKQQVLPFVKDTSSRPQQQQRQQKQNNRQPLQSVNKGTASKHVAPKTFKYSTKRLTSSAKGSSTLFELDSAAHHDEHSLSLEQQVQQKQNIAASMASSPWNKPSTTLRSKRNDNQVQLAVQNCALPENSPIDNNNIPSNDISTTNIHGYNFPFPFSTPDNQQQPQLQPSSSVDTPFGLRLPSFESHINNFKAEMSSIDAQVDQEHQKAIERVNAYFGALRASHKQHLKSLVNQLQQQINLS